MYLKKREKGFTLVEVMMVVVILAVLAVIAIPKYGSSTDTARKNSDIATARQVKSALDRYQVDYGIYPKAGELTVDENGVVSSDKLIPKYISRLDKSVTQQRSSDKSGFGVATITGGTYPAPTNIIMIYLSSDGSVAEVKAYDSSGTTLAQLWASN
ncbi:MAG: prepilin-type N-terminal cleavage/methylation domain-containing protein [Desulfitobacterium hafniense]|nr:prepilin-type N-terminal cleavage/methylation domain-containing protein [Desulfitobacterium hafniense]